MIWVRRTILFLLVITLLPLVFISIVLLRLNDTFLNPAFYPSLLEKTGVYRFVMVDVLTSALDEARDLDPEALGVDLDQNPLSAYGPATPLLVDAVNRALPPEDLEAMIAPATLGVGEYIAAKRDTLTLRVSAQGRVETLVRELKEVMNEANTYDLILAQEMEPRIRESASEALESDPNLTRRASYLFGSTEEAADRLAEASRLILTAEWLQAQAEQALDEVTPFLAGESDNFEIRVRPTEEQVEAATEEAKAILREVDTYNLLFDQEIEPRVRDAANETGASNESASRWMLHLFGADGDATDRLIQAIRRIVTSEWTRAQIESAVDEVTPFLVGESDDFEVTVRLTDDQVDAAAEEAKAILREANAYDLLYAELIEPAVRDNLGEAVSLPYGVEITEDELVAVIRQAAPPAWVRQQADLLIDDVGRYIAGRTHRFSTEVSLIGNKANAEGILADLADAKLAEVVRGLPACRKAETLAASNRLRYGLPSCVPQGISANDIIEKAGPEVAGSIRPVVLALVPNSVRFTDSSFRSGIEQTAGGQDALDLLDDGRELFGEGWNYGSVDLRADLTGSSAETLDDLRTILADGYVYTHKDLRDDLAGRGDIIETLDEIRTLLADDYVYNHEYGIGERPISRMVRDLDIMHSQAMAVRRFGWTAYVLTPILLIGIMLLSGSRWIDRMWRTSAFLLVSAVVSFVAVGPFYDALFAPGFDQAHADIMARSGGDFGDTFLLVANKVRELSNLARSEFVGGVRLTSLILTGFVASALLVILFRTRIPPRVPRPRKVRAGF